MIRKFGIAFLTLSIMNSQTLISSGSQKNEQEEVVSIENYSIENSSVHNEPPVISVNLPQLVAWLRLKYEMHRREAIAGGVLAASFLLVIIKAYRNGVKMTRELLKRDEAMRILGERCGNVERRCDVLEKLNTQNPAANENDNESGKLKSRHGSSKKNHSLRKTTRADLRVVHSDTEVDESDDEKIKFSDALPYQERLVQVAQPAQNGNEQNGLSTRVLLTPDDRQYLKILATQLPAALNASVNEERGSQVNNGASEATTGGGWMPAWFGSPTKSKSTNA